MSKRSEYLAHRKLMRLADSALSRYIRKESKKLYGKCPFCKAKPIQVSFHFIGRRRKATRWDVRNLVGACKTCNYWERFFPDRYRAWFIRNRGVGLYLELVDNAEEVLVPSKEYLEDIIKLHGGKKC